MAVPGVKRIVLDWNQQLQLVAPWRRGRSRPATGWMEVGPGMLKGVFPAARAHRMPDDLVWSSILRRVTRDAADDSVISDIYPASGCVPETAAGARLARVCDIVVEIEYANGGVNRSPGLGPRRVRRADEAEGEDLGVTAGTVRHPGIGVE